MRMFITLFSLLFVGLAQGSPGPHALSAATDFWKARHMAEQVTVLENLSADDFQRSGRNSFSSALAVVSLTKSGRDLLEKLLPLASAHELKWLPISSPEAKEIPGLTARTGGLYFKRVIFIDDTLPLISFSAYFFHKSIHAREFLVEPDGAAKSAQLDELGRTATSLQKADSEHEKITPEQNARFQKLWAERAKTSVHSECMAYHAENDFLKKELVEIDPSYQSFIETAVKNERLVAFPITDSLIRAILIGDFKLPRELVDRELERGKI